MIRKFFVVLLVLMLTGIPGAIANETTPVDFEEGTTAKENTEVVMDKGLVVFTDKSTGLYASTTTTIDGVAFIPAKTTESKDLEWSTGEVDPIVKMVYSYDGKTLKEIITLKEDKVLTFPITLSTYSKLVPWDHGQWKIVRSNSFETMTGIILEKPYGIDANGKRIEMEYTYEKGVLTLVYDRTITEWVEEEKIVIDNKTSEETTEIVWVQKQSQIAYPLVIDPTWVAYNGHWIDNTTNATYTVEMWNATGSTTWTPPAGVSSVEYLVVAGGGSGGSGGNSGNDPPPGGGGGGAGGYITATGLAVSNHLDIVVGNGGSTTIYNLGVNGGNSSLTVNDGTPILMLGGGGGGSRQLNGGAVIQNGFNGGSGGGAGMNYAAGTSGTAGTADGTYGKSGGASFPGSPWGLPCGGGGGAGGVGITPASSQGAGGNGGLGILNTITGSNSYYAAGGGGSADNLYSGVYGTGGSSIGGNGGNRTVSPTSGIDGTGSGGGGLYFNTRGNPGSGGSGIVIIKYLTPPTVAPIASFVIALTDTSTGSSLSWQWNVTNLLGNNTEVTFSTSRHTNMTLGQGNWLVKLTATNSLGSSSATKYIGLNLSSPLVYFWNRTG